MKARPARNHWLWVTRPEYYLNEDGSDRDVLEPSDVAEPGGWWTCDRATRQGDLVLLYRTHPKKDIAYLIEAGSDAYPLESDDVADERWTFGCDFHVVTKFTHPLTLSEMRSEAALSNWGALRRNFQGIVFPIESRIWDCLTGLLRRKNPIAERLRISPRDSRSRRTPQRRGQSL